MRTVKLVVIGASGVGKSSIRNQYISGQFTTGYRATIGADFITKTLPHHSLPGEFVTLQIWDTAGQERFSALSSAFFRGADAVILMFDVNQPHTLEALTKWWADFRDKAPVPDDAVDEFCCVVVGNKIDIARAHAQASGSGNGSDARVVVSEAEARAFMNKLVPRPDSPPSPTILLAPPESDDPFVCEGAEDADSPLSDQPHVPRTDSIDISARRGRASWTHLSRSASRSRSTLFKGTCGGTPSSTVGTMNTTNTIYHTPSSSLFDTFESALSSPAFTALSAPASRGSPSHSYPRSQSRSLSPSPSPSPEGTRSPRRVPSASSLSSAPTITPSLFIRGLAEPDLAPTTTTTTPESSSPPNPSRVSPPARPSPPPVERYPKLFFTSAKTGEGVRDVFEYVARRVVARQEYEEALEARTMHVLDADADQAVAGRIRLASSRSAGAADARWAAGAGSCCGS
ncbi:P-loop containing nucleoside triphosphate hydrolase protein [Trametes punicea]|nr:P-loop containing nucleoside triphosphate hydrolase protein [Trametes punicea]